MAHSDGVNKSRRNHVDCREDQKLPEHWGLDVAPLSNSAQRTNESIRGASTISVDGQCFYAVYWKPD